MQGASFELSFMGTAVYIYGSGLAEAYTTSLDDGPPAGGAPEDGILASYANLEYKKHKLVLKLTQSQSLSLSSALVTVGVGQTGAMVTQTTMDAVIVNADGTSSLNTSVFSTSGAGFNTRGNNDVLAYPRIDTNTAGSAIIVRFDGASAIRVHGAVYHDHGTFTAVLNPPAGASDSPQTFNSTSKWFASDVLVYWESGLDPTQSYSLSLTNGEQNKYLDVHSVVLMDGKGGMKDTATSSSPIASTLVNGSPTGDVNSSSNGSSRTSLGTGAIAGIATEKTGANGL
ncbi:hypothetical protein V5O48_005078 [Marasmius crinis-equi]|uniref:Uncharacterized protein n=1 Tax=Marasmius crinis-equi TaxID=585013 RepID=A0ABR3FNQ3_9AGAR